MQEAIEKLAARMACLQNNIDIYQAEHDTCEKGHDWKMAQRYRVAIDQLECEVHGMMHACRCLGCYVQLDGPEMHRTCTIRVSGTYTSHAKQRHGLKVA